MHGRDWPRKEDKRSSATLNCGRRHRARLLGSFYSTGLVLLSLPDLESAALFCAMRWRGSFVSCSLHFHGLSRCFREGDQGA